AGVDPTNGNVLITEGSDVREFDAYGNNLGTLPESGSSEAAPAVNSEGYAYVPAGPSIDIFAPAHAMPTITYKPITSPTLTSATVNATVNPNGGGNVTSCQFEYVPTSEFQEGMNNHYAAGLTAPCEPGTPYSGVTDVSAAISGLTTDTPYRYRVVVHTAGGVKYGADQELTPQHVLDLRTEAATNLTESGATVNASLVGNGEEAHFHFEWGPTQAYGHTTSVSSVSPAGGTRESTSAQLGGLAPVSTYHYRVIADNGGGSSVGEDRTFTTTPGIPSVVGDSATIVHADRAVLHGQVNPNGADTKVTFEYVPDAQYQESGFA